MELVGTFSWSTARLVDRLDGIRWHPQPPQGPWSRGRLPPSESPREGCRFGRPQGGASSPICLYPSDSCRSFGPPGGGYARRVQRRPLPVDLVGLAQPIQQDSMQLFPHACLVPFLETTPAGHARAASHLLGQHLPRDAALQDEQYAGEGRPPVVDARPAALGLGWLFREQRLDHFPQLIGNEFLSHTFSLPT